MTPRQKRLHKLGNALRNLRGSWLNARRTDAKSKAHYERRLAICKAKGDL